MRKLLRRREIVADDWRHLNEEPVSGPDSVIVPLAQLRKDPAGWHAAAARLGVRIGPADRVEEFAAELAHLALVAVEFPSPGEGRGYTQGRLLRTRLGFQGELRAVGAGVKRDLIWPLSRCGFDAFEIAAGEDIEAAAQALNRYSVAYQTLATQPSVRQYRFSV